MPDSAEKVAEEMIVRRFHIVLCDCSTKVCAAGQAGANVLRSEIVDALRLRDRETEQRVWVETYENHLHFCKKCDPFRYCKEAHWLRHKAQEVAKEGK